MANATVLHVQLPRPNCSAPVLRVIAKAEKTIQDAFDLLGDSPMDPEQELVESSLVDPWGPNDAPDGSGPVGPGEPPDGVGIGTGATAGSYLVHKGRIICWRQQLQDSGIAAGSVVGSAGIGVVSARGQLTRILHTLIAQLSIPGKLTSAQEATVLGEINTALAGVHTVVTQTQQEASSNAGQIDQSTPTTPLITAQDQVTNPGVPATQQSSGSVPTQGPASQGSGGGSDIMSTLMPVIMAAIAALSGNKNLNGQQPGTPTDSLIPGHPAIPAAGVGLPTAV